MDWNNSPPFGYSTFDLFKNHFIQITKDSFKPFQLDPVFSEHRLLDAYEAWQFDLKRSQDNFKAPNTYPDHIKCAGYLMHWLKRFSPITELSDPFYKWATESERASILGKFIFVTDEESLPEGTRPAQLDEIPSDILQQFNSDNGIELGLFAEHRNWVASYFNEFAAWDFCYRLAQGFETQKNLEKNETKNKANEPAILYSFKIPSTTFIHDFCHLLKYKSVSPQGIAFLLRAALRDLE
jgi:hypothetical protein